MKWDFFYLHFQGNPFQSGENTGESPWCHEREYLWLPGTTRYGSQAFPETRGRKAGRRHRRQDTQILSSVSCAQNKNQLSALRKNAKLAKEIRHHIISAIFGTFFTSGSSYECIYQFNSNYSASWAQKWGCNTIFLVLRYVTLSAISVQMILIFCVWRTQKNSPVLLFQFGQQLQFIGTKVLGICWGQRRCRQRRIVGGGVGAKHRASRGQGVLVRGRRRGGTLQLGESPGRALPLWAAAGDGHGAGPGGSALSLDTAGLVSCQAKGSGLVKPAKRTENGQTGARLKSLHRHVSLG